MSDSVVEIISWEKFQEAIAPMWDIGDPNSIPIVNNPYRVISFDVKRWPTNIVHYPLRYTEDGVVKGYTCVYNVSYSTVRIRGIYILPEFRGNGAGMRMTKAAMSVFPSGFNRMVGFFKESTAQRFIDHCDFVPLPNTDWLWSDFQQTRIRVLCWDRWPRMMNPQMNGMFIAGAIPEFGFGGSNNLNVNWTEEEWLEFVEPHANVYPDIGLNVDI